jgi:CcmD family protein
MSNLTWLFIAFMAVWIGIGVYLLSITFRQRALERRIERISPEEAPSSHSR